MNRNRFLLSGSGGQGVITMGILLAESAAIHEGLTAIQSQSYGPEARGGATRCDVLIDTRPILFPKVLEANVMVCLTQEAFNKYNQFLRPGGMLVTDRALVKTPSRVDAEHYALDMQEAVMEKIGRMQVFNICVLGALVELTKAVRPESILKNLAERFAPAFHAANESAMKLGAELAGKYAA
jgi:2-oxoglutarate ferredoxin oxidoreductase subunit gamma